MVFIGVYSPPKRARISCMYLIPYVVSQAYTTLSPAIPGSPIARDYPLNERWASLALYGKRAPLRRKLRGQHKHARKAKLYENEQSKMPNGARQPLLEPTGFSQLVQVLNLQLLLPLAVSSNGAAFLQLSMTSSGEGRWLNLQIQRSRKIVYANIASTAD